MHLPSAVAHVAAPPCAATTAVRPCALALLCAASVCTSALRAATLPSRDSTVLPLSTGVQTPTLAVLPALQCTPLPLPPLLLLLPPAPPLKACTKLTESPTTTPLMPMPDAAVVKKPLDDSGVVAAIAVAVTAANPAAAAAAAVAVAVAALDVAPATVPAASAGTGATAVMDLGVPTGADAGTTGSSVAAPGSMHDTASGDSAVAARSRLTAPTAPSPPPPPPLAAAGRLPDADSSMESRDDRTALSSCRAACANAARAAGVPAADAPPKPMRR